MKKTTYTPYTQIIAHLPINKGDILYVASDILGIAKDCRENGERFSCERFIESIADAVGNEGTILFPTFNWDFCRGKAFNYKETRGNAGALGNAALKMPAFKRTRHPLYSFMVWGKDADELVGLQNKASFGEDSPFAYLHKKQAKFFSIGLTPSKGNTFVLYAEQAIGVDYRYEKNFQAEYIDENGIAENRVYSMYVRDLELNPMVKQAFKVLDEIMLTLNILKSFTVNSVPYHIVDLKGLFDLVALEIKYNNANNLYSRNEK